jgi:hypothetical protein
MRSYFFLLGSSKIGVATGQPELVCESHFLINFMAKTAEKNPSLGNQDT